jgi:hypothetical protein
MVKIGKYRPLNVLGISASGGGLAEIIIPYIVYTQLTNSENSVLTELHKPNS